jgi:hypothetical protein
MDDHQPTLAYCTNGYLMSYERKCFSCIFVSQFFKLMLFFQIQSHTKISSMILGHDRFLSNPFQFMILLIPFHPTLYSLSY